jgi:PAS domain S-box-containing protein
LTRWGDPASNGGFAAIARDISERKAHEAEKARAAKFLDSVVSNLPVMLFVRETQSRKYVMINRAAEEVLGRKAKDIIGKTDEEVLPHLAASLQRRDDEALASPGRHIHEGIYRYHDGRPIHLRTTRAVIDGPDGPDQLMLWVSEDVTEVKGAQAEINKLAKTDSSYRLAEPF